MARLQAVTSVAQKIIQNMSLVNIDSIRRQTLRLLDRIDPPGGIEFLSYKRNRSVAIVCLGYGNFFVREKGYDVQEIHVGRDRLPRILKAMIKKEFPRSRKVRLFKFQDMAELDRVYQKI
jgi:hypothetical protein